MKTNQTQETNRIDSGLLGVVVAGLIVGAGVTGKLEKVIDKLDLPVIMPSIESYNARQQQSLYERESRYESSQEKNRNYISD